jgi:hypothetical protein
VRPSLGLYNTYAGVDVLVVALNLLVVALNLLVVALNRLQAGRYNY